VEKLEKVFIGRIRIKRAGRIGRIKVLYIGREVKA